MAAIITEKFRVHNAKQFKEDFGESASSTYVFIGRSHPWTVDTSPPTPVNGTSEEVDAWSDMTALKKVGSADVSHGLTRYDWTTGTKYDEYAHDYSATNTSPATASTSLFSSRFYVMTDEYHVYKCIRTGRNTSGAAVESTVKPTGTSATALVETSDTGAGTGRGYIWKYMYTVTASDTIKFVTNDFIPVKTIGAQGEVDGDSGGLGTTASDDGSSQWDVENSAVDGGVHHANVTAGGSGYTNGDGAYEDVHIVGDGSGGRATVHVSGGAVTHVTITTVGTGYKIAQIIIATTTQGLSGIGSGSGAVVKCIVSPQTGHGADPVQELGGNHVIVNSRLEFGEGGGDFPTDNDFRRIGLVQDPFSSGTTVASAASLAAYSQMTVSSASNLSVDDIIRSASADASGVANSRIVSITGNVVSHLPIADSAGGFTNFAAGNDVYLGSSDEGSVSSVNAAFPELVKHSGQILYIENRGAVTRAADQIEDIKLIIEM
jgi:hypothetical protein